MNKKIKYLKMHKKDTCPASKEIIEYNDCKDCEHSGSMSWVTKSEKGIEKYTVMCGFPLSWDQLNGWHDDT